MAICTNCSARLSAGPTCPVCSHDNRVAYNMAYDHENDGISKLGPLSDAIRQFAADRRKEEVIWCGSEPRCDIAKHILNTTHDLKGVFFDGATTLGKWAGMCFECHMMYGQGLGVGRGQKYVKQRDGL